MIIDQRWIKAETQIFNYQPDFIISYSKLNCHFSFIISHYSMLKLGLKVGPTDWREKFNKLGELPDFVEVYFKTDSPADYQDLFKHLQQNRIKTRLHLWALIDNLYFPSIAVGDASFVKKSLDLIFKNIQIAQEHNFQAVVFHIGQNRQVKFNFETREYTPVGNKTPENQICKTAVAAMKKIIDYGNKMNVLPLVENECFAQASIWDRQKKTQGEFEELTGNDISPEVFQEIAGLGRFICLDIAHLATWCDQINPPDRRSRFNELLRLSNLLKDGVGGMHAGSVLPNYLIDTDSAFMPDELTDGAFPNIEELTEILSIFHKAPQEIMIVGEPRAEDHIETYRLLKDLINKISNI